MHKSDFVSLLATFVGVGALATDAAFGQYLQTLFGTHTTQILAGVAIVGLVSAQVLRVLNNPSPPAGQVSVTTTKPPQP
jgi:tetrahydromethanopterin S-methyltransferase subunit D